jgi:hypothetical protein
VNINDFANMACRDLPDGWELLLRMEKGSGGFDLYAPDGIFVHSEDYSSVDNSLVEQGMKAIEYAQGLR